uniref:Protein kinase domain-containing protein n=1 Tax=Acrobeloides nanus TaxID=290746 RepID=A0A914D5Z5_9BILA
MANEMSSYVITPLYRPPEILCLLLDPNNHYGNYRSAADIWSVGCIIAELFLCHPLFYMDNTELNEIRSIEYLTNRTIVHIERIFHLCGTPNEDFLQRISYTPLHEKVSSLSRFPRQEFAPIFQDPEKYFGQFFNSYMNTVYVTPSLDTIALLDKILVIEPDQRISARDALASDVFLNLASNYHSQANSQGTSSNGIDREMLEQEQTLRGLSLNRNDIGYHTKDIALLVLPGIFGLFGLLAFIVIKAKQWSDWARFAVYLLHMVINFLSFFLTLQIYFLYCAFLDFNASLEMYRYKTNLNAEKTYSVVVP